MAVPVISSIFPFNGYNQFPVKGTIEFVFNTEIDSESLSISLVGPNKDIYFGPAMESAILPRRLGTAEVAFRHPGGSGEVRGMLTIERIDGDDEVVDEPCHDEDDLLRTRVKFTPLNPLLEKTPYRMVFAGSETEEYGICSRSVFDPEADSDNTSNGEIYSYGSYTGTVEDTLIIEIIDSGDNETARFSYYLESNDSRKKYGYGGTTELEGLSGVRFLLVGEEFEAGDLFTIKLIPREFMESSHFIEFITGDEIVEEIPVTASTSPIGLVTELGEFLLVSVTPSDRSSNLPLSTGRVIFEFSKELDADAILPEHIRVLSREVSGADEIREEVFQYIVDGRYLYIFLNPEGV